MELYKYKTYKSYKEWQIYANKKKIHSVWVRKNDIKMLSEYIKKIMPEVKYGLCHGTRNGTEQKLFKQHLGISVIGTEISPTAKDFPDTIQWDFHKLKKEWIGKFDFIFSNALDHSYNPPKCIDTWMKCLKQNGICIIEWSKGHKYSNKIDCFGATREEYKEMFAKKYCIKKVIKGYKKTKDKKSFFIIRKHDGNS